MESLLSPPCSTLTIYALVKTQSWFPKTKILWRSIQKRDQKVGILLRLVRVAIDIDISYTLIVKNGFFFRLHLCWDYLPADPCIFPWKVSSKSHLTASLFPVVFPLVNCLSFNSCLIKKVFISDNNRIRTHNHLIHKRALSSMVECSFTN